MISCKTIDALLLRAHRQLARSVAYHDGNSLPISIRRAHSVVRFLEEQRDESIRRARKPKNRRTT